MPPKSRTAAGAKKVRRKEKKNVAHGHAHIKSTFNNTIVSITDPTGAVIAWASAGRSASRARGSPRRTPRRWPPRLPPGEPWSTACARSTCSSGPRLGRETAIRSLQATGLEVGSIQDVTPSPHNGCRPPKRRRV